MSLFAFDSSLLPISPVLGGCLSSAGPVALAPQSVFGSTYHMFIFLSSLRSVSSMSGDLIKCVDFEVFGRVQGVFFRKHTQDQAKQLSLRGWCKNTPQGTVQGQIQGPPDKIETMKFWLKNTGSPQSSIDKVEFKNEKTIDKYAFNDFDIIRKQR